MPCSQEKPKYKNINNIVTNIIKTFKKVHITKKNNFKNVFGNFWDLKIFIFYWRTIALQNFAVFWQTSTWICQTFNHIIVLLYGNLYNQDDSNPHAHTTLLSALTIFSTMCHCITLVLRIFFQTFSAAAHPAWCLKMQYVRWKWKTHVFSGLGFKCYWVTKKHRFEKKNFKQTILKCRYPVVPKVANRKR